MAEVGWNRPKFFLLISFGNISPRNSNLIVATWEYFIMVPYMENSRKNMFLGHLSSPSTFFAQLTITTSISFWEWLESLKFIHLKACLTSLPWDDNSTDSFEHFAFCMCVRDVWTCFYKCFQVWGLTCIGRCMWRLEVNVGFFLDRVLPYTVWQGLRSNPEHAILICLASQPAPESPVSASGVLRLHVTATCT